jgi:hypothetical protein
MRSNSLKFVLGIGVVTLMAWSTPACSSDDDEGGGGTGGTAGSSGGAAGSTGGTGGGTGGKGGTGGGTGGSGGGAQPVQCGSNTCEPVNVLGAVDLPACCDEVNTDNCGLDLAIAQSFIPQLPSGCTELNQPGNPSSECPPLALDVMGTAIDLPGCCRPAGKCGFLANIEQAPGADFGCVDPADFPDVDAGTPGDCDPAGTDAGTGGSAGGGNAGAPGTGGSAGGDAAAD